MKTTIDIPGDMLEDLMRYSRASTKKEAVITAIDHYTRRRKMQELTSILGTFEDFMDGEELERSRRRS